MDRDLYKGNMQRRLLVDNEYVKRDGKDSLHLVEGSVADLLIEDGKCVGIKL